MSDSFGVRYNEALRERVKSMIEDRLSLIISKKCVSHEDYLGKCEAVQALRDVLEAAEDIHKKLLREATGPIDVETPVMQPRQRPTVSGSRYRS